MKTENPPVFALSYIPLLFRLRCLEAVELPVFLGSTLHGALGWKLLNNKRVYQALFETRTNGQQKQDIAKAYILTPPKYHGQYQEGDELVFELDLIGDRALLAGQMIMTIANQPVFELGVFRKKFQLTEIIHSRTHQTVWNHNGLSSNGLLPAELISRPGPDCQNCALQFMTPLRIRRNGALLTEIDFTVIMRNIARRISELTDCYGGAADKEEMNRMVQLAEAVGTASMGIGICRIERYSTRREEKMDFSGVMGGMTFTGALSPFIPYLEAAEILHIGRNVTFGFGKVAVTYW